MCVRACALVMYSLTGVWLSWR